MRLRQLLQLQRSLSSDNTCFICNDARPDSQLIPCKHRRAIPLASLLLRALYLAITCSLATVAWQRLLCCDYASRLPREIPLSQFYYFVLFHYLKINDRNNTIKLIILVCCSLYSTVLQFEHSLNSRLKYSLTLAHFLILPM